MKIEMGESLFYSWLRHVKGCQIVQTNWKTSPAWEIEHMEEIETVFKRASQYFQTEYNYDLFKKNNSVSQIIRQAEVDVIGVQSLGMEQKIIAVDVAFHEGGLMYGSRQETVAKVLAKLVRTSMCIYGCFNSRAAEVVFASPKIQKSVQNDLLSAVEQLNIVLAECGFEMHTEVIANDDFNNKVLQMILEKSGDVADTAELFMRSYQMYKMFSK